ncbi:MAG: sarcosine oxidase subunit gamma [Hyphomicrobiaceae bacterium]
MSAPEIRSPLATFHPRGPVGAAGDMPLSLTEVRLAIVQVQARKGRAEAVTAALDAALGLSLPGAGRFTRHGELSAVSIAPQTWLITAPLVQDGALHDRLSGLLAGLAAVTDQSHGKTALKLSGRLSRSVLDKGCRVDLHPRAFGKGHAAVTTIDHVGVLIAQTDDVPTYYLIAPSTLVKSLLSFLVTSAAEFGCMVLEG